MYQASQNIQNLMRNPETIRANAVLSLLDDYAGKIKILSLDCFDTLLWRKAATPKDVFHDLQTKPVFHSMGFNGTSRINAEIKVRNLMTIRSGTGEVKLKDIYKEGFHSLSDDQINALIKEELETELELCYAFPPILDLIKEAHRRNIKVIVVSDTYFEEQQLRQLLSTLLPAEIYSTISRVFCSCDYGKSKLTGIFPDVMRVLKCDATSILHIGDNIAADYVRPRSLNIYAKHFIQHDEYITDLRRLQDTSAKMIDPNVSSAYSLFSPFSAILAMNSFSKNNPETMIGYASLGPVMYAFAKFICDEVNELKSKDKNPKVLFLMRDAYLPYLASSELTGSELGKCVRISRFASYASSFMTVEDIDSYIVEMGVTDRFQDLARQLLLPEKVAEPILKITMRSQNPAAEFFKQIRRNDIARIILKKSAEYRERLLKHLESEVGLERGCTLVLVDLGYSGTAQRRLSPVFKKMEIDVVGRYLISLRVPGWENNRRGLIDPSWCDDRAMHTIVIYIMLLEQLCTSNEKSVIDYDEKGNPIYSSVMMNENQQNKLKLIQSECLRFIRDAKQFFQSTNIPISQNMLRQSALTELARMIFLPTEIELKYLKTFEAEMNLGKQDILRVFDPEQGLMGLRRRGMFYMEKPSKSTRTNYPAELRSAGIELVLTLIAQHRFGLDLKLKDMVLRKEFIQVIFHQGNNKHKMLVDAVATHDGFFTLWLPTQLHTSINLGEKYKWMQIESSQFIPLDAFVKQMETLNTTDAWSYLNFESMIDHGERLFELSKNSSSLNINPISKSGTNEFVFRLVFRPIVKRVEEVVKDNELLTEAG